MTCSCGASDCPQCGIPANEGYKRKLVSPSTDIPPERRLVNIDPEVLRWLLGSNNEGFPIVLILKEDISPKKFCESYSVLDMRWETDRPMVTVTAHREDVFLFSWDSRVLEIREGVHLCNKCGSDMTRFLDTSETVSEICGLAASYTAGYASDPLPDGTRYFFNLCESCLAALFETFDIPPTKEELL